MSDDYRYENNDELNEYSGQSTFRLVEEAYRVEEPYSNDNGYRGRREYDQGYYNNENDKKKKEKEKKSPKRGGTIALALVFSIIGSLIGGAFGAKLAYDKYSEEKNIASTSAPVYTINTKDEVNTVSAVAAANLDSVVGITTTTIMRDIFNRQYGAQAMGSGFIVDENGYIMTNDHVISSLTSRTGYSSDRGYADEVTVVFNDGTQLPAEILWSDSNLDLAILKVNPDRPLKVVKLGDSDKLIIGEQAIAIGNPFALEFHGTVTAGYISGLERTVSGQGGEMQNLIQTDASINQGNSGGPLLNSKGEVIGINTLKISSGEGLGFSIPINVAKPIIEQVVETGSYERVILGIKGANLVDYEKMFGVDLTPDSGIIIAEVTPGSPAEKAGLRSNDIITKIDGEEFEDFDGLQARLYNYSFGDKVIIEYYRDGKTYTTDLTFELNKSGRSS